MNSLQEIGKFCQTDKHNDVHTFANKSYLDIYESYLSHLRNRDISLLEIGVRDGCSHRMWQSFFTKNSKIYGIDIDPRCKIHNQENIKIFVGDQADQGLIETVAADNADGFDVILDDGSHINDLTVKSFNLLFPHLKNGGIYIIEDLGCSYLGDNLYSDIIKGGWPGMQYNKNIEQHVNDRNIINSLFFDIIRQIDQISTTQFEWIHFYSRIAIIKKQS